MASTWGDSWGISWSFSWDIGSPTPDATVGGKSWKWKEGVKRLQLHRHSLDVSVKKAAAVMSKAGGHARAASLTSTQRSNIASTAAKARWK